MNLPEQETWHVQDATKIQAYLNCPRRYFYEYVLGWKPDLPDLHLEFGNAWHLAMETLAQRGYGVDAIEEAFSRFQAHWEAKHTAAWDLMNTAKNPVNAQRGLVLYAQHYKEDHFDVLHTEVAGTVAVDEERTVHFKMDTICHDERGYFSLEHKTGTNFSTSWGAQWRQKIQTWVYTHVLYCLYPQDEVYGTVINGAFLHGEPKLKKDGTPYANEKDTEFHRVPVRRNMQAMEAGLYEVQHHLLAIENDFRNLRATHENDPILPCFIRNTESCTHYGVCPFLDFCSLWHNPLQHVQDYPQGFTIRHWDPRNQENVKEVMSL